MKKVGENNLEAIKEEKYKYRCDMLSDTDKEARYFVKVLPFPPILFFGELESRNKGWCKSVTIQKLLLHGID